MITAWRRDWRKQRINTERFAREPFRFALLCLLVMMHGAVETPAAAQTTLPPPAASSSVDIQTQVSVPAKEQIRPLRVESFGGQILFEAEIGGRSVWGIFDNGFSRTVIDTGFAKSIGLELGPQDATPPVANVTTLGGALPLKFVSTAEIKIPGQFSFRSSPQLSTDLSRLTPLVGHPISLVIGKDLFDQFLFAFSVRERTFQLGRSGIFRASPEMIELNLKNDPPQLDVVINGHAATVSVDLGYDGFIALGDSAWSRLGLDQLAVKYHTFAAADGTISGSRTAIVNEVSVGPVNLRKMPVSRTAVLPGEGDGRIGTGFFSGFNFVIDQKAHRIWLQHLSKPDADAAKGDKDRKIGREN